MAGVQSALVAFLWCGSQGTWSGSLSLQRSVIGCAVSAVQDMRKCVLKQGSGRVWWSTETKCGSRPTGRLWCVLQWPAVLWLCRGMHLLCAVSGLKQHLACNARREKGLA